jgi:hypothetical protein
MAAHNGVICVRPRGWPARLAESSAYSWRIAMRACACSYVIGAVSAAAIPVEGFFFGVRAGARASRRIGCGGLTVTGRYGAVILQPWAARRGVGLAVASCQTATGIGGGSLAGDKRPRHQDV